MKGFRSIFPVLLVPSIIGLLALGRIHLRHQSTLIGYEMGELKKKEIALLDELGLLEVQWSELTKRSALEQRAFRHTP